jgi:hypothetical protein
MENAMRLWQLQPIDLADPSWEASSYRGKVIVRARDEEAAREVAATAFDVKTRFRPGKSMIAPPWRRPTVVRVETVDDPLYSTDGPAEVLFPPLE